MVSTYFRRRTRYFRPHLTLLGTTALNYVRLIFVYVYSNVLLLLRYFFYYLYKIIKAVF